MVNTVYEDPFVGTNEAIVSLTLSLVEYLSIPNTISFD